MLMIQNTCAYEKTINRENFNHIFISYLPNKVKIFISCIFKISVFQVLKFILVDIDNVNRHLFSFQRALT